MAGVGMSWPGPTLSLDAQSRQVMSDLRYVQQLSMMRGQRYHMEILSDRYRLKDQAGSVIANAKNGAADVLLPQGMTVASSSPVIAFDGRGVPYGDSAIPGTALTIAATINISQAGETRTVSVGSQTGRVWLQ